LIPTVCHIYLDRLDTAGQSLDAEMVKVVGYIRVSTERQADEGFGLDVQERAVRAWARRERHRVVRICRDEGVSGAQELDHRPGLADALELLQSGEARGLVVPRLDRLARDLVLQEQLLAEVRRLGGEPFSTSGGEGGYLADDPDDPSRKLIRQVLGAVSEYERSMISVRLRNGRRRKAERGGFAYGSPSYGHRAEHRELVPDAREQAALDRIRALHGEGASLRTIAAVLAEEGHRPRRSVNWHPESLRRIISRL
jgi:DNA invertase Pin-like site-specific DNA recombinase